MKARIITRNYSSSWVFNESSNVPGPSNELFPSAYKGTQGLEKIPTVDFFRRAKLEATLRPTVKGLSNYVIRHDTKYGNIMPSPRALTTSSTLFLITLLGLMHPNSAWLRIRDTKRTENITFWWSSNPPKVLFGSSLLTISVKCTVLSDVRYVLLM